KKQVLFLAPEIGLTTQLVQRLTAYFGNKVAVYNSKYSDNERVEVYHHVLNGHENAQIVIGSRASGFLRSVDLGLVIADEELEATRSRTTIPYPSCIYRVSKNVSGKGIIRSGDSKVRKLLQRLSGKIRIDRAVRTVQ